MKGYRVCKSYQPTNPKKNPYADLLARISGNGRPPKARQGFQQFMRERYHDVIEPEVKKQWAEKISQDDITSDQAFPGTGFRAAVARQLFNELPVEEQAGYKKRAKDDAAIAREAYNKAPVDTIESRTRAIEAIPYLLAPLLQGLAEQTGLQFTVLYGGPNPRYGGEISVDVLSYGTSCTNPPKTFSEWDPAGFDQMVESFKDWLVASYSADDIKAAQGPVPPVSDNDPMIFDDDDPVHFCPFGEPIDDSDDEDSSSDLDDESDESDEDSDTTVVAPRKRTRAAVMAGRPTKRQKSDAFSKSKPSDAPGHQSKGKQRLR